MALHRKPATVCAVFFCIIIFARAAQVKSSHAVTPAGALVIRKVQQPVIITAAGSETGAVVKTELQHETMNKVLVRGSMTPMAGWQLRTVPSGPDPLHHHREVPMRPETP